MDTHDIIRAQLDHTLEGTELSGLGQRYRGKVRDVYRQDDRLILVTTDRVSAFDHVLGTIPFKGQILNEMALDAFAATEDVVPNHVLDVPDPNVIVGRRCEAYPVEFIVRGYITGSLWRDYLSGAAEAYDIDLPGDLKKDQAFSQPILTPSTKAALGAHDEPISRKEILRRGLMSERRFDEAAEAAHALYQRGRERAAERGLVLVDTKYELGPDPDGRLTVIDEIHTPDSSRYWIAEEYEARFAAGEPQAMLDKENLRGWLIDTHGFSGHGEPPKLDDAIRVTLCERYMDAYRRLLGRDFAPQAADVHQRIQSNLRKAGLLS